NATYTLDFYSNGACRGWEGSYLQGETPLGSTQVTTDANGTAVIDVTVPGSIGAGDRVSCTATDAQGSTSEFSQPPIVVVNPSAGPATGGTMVEVYGSDFSDGATLTVGGAPATDVTFVDFNHLTATLPPLGFGSVNDFTVSFPDGTAGTREGAYTADFADVPETHPFYFYITALNYNRVTPGAGRGAS